MIEFCGIPLAHRVINGSGTFDAIAARKAFGDAIYEQFPFAAFVSKTVTLEPREGNPPPRLWELAGGMVNSIGLPNKGLHGYLESGRRRWLVLFAGAWLMQGLTNGYFLLYLPVLVALWLIWFARDRP